VVAATAIGSGTYVYGVYVLQHINGGDGRPVNEHVEWVGGGASTTMLGGLKAGKFDAIMAVPEWQSAAIEEGFGNRAGPSPLRPSRGGSTAGRGSTR
jgi:hypothetical protein